MKQWNVTYRALFAADGKPSGQFIINADSDQDARNKAQMAMHAKSTELGETSFHLHITEKPTMDAYAQAVEQDRKFMEKMLKTLTPEQVNRFCFENGYSVPEPKGKK